MHKAEPPLAVVDLLYQHPQVMMIKASRDPLDLLSLQDENPS